MSDPQKVAIIGMVWYRDKPTYDRCMAMWPDRHTLPDTFDDFLKIAEEGRQYLINNGHVVVKAYIDPDSFRQWCRDTGHNIDADARVDFANEVASRHLHRETNHE
jgi:hypothetical protein